MFIVFHLERGSQELCCPIDLLVESSFQVYAWVPTSEKKWHFYGSKDERSGAFMAAKTKGIKLRFW